MVQRSQKETKDMDIQAERAVRARTCLRARACPCLVAHLVSRAEFPHVSIHNYTVYSVRSSACPFWRFHTRISFFELKETTVFPP
jgi:hypothetical protein